MTEAGPRNTITDVAGITVGNAEDQAAGSGVTVIIPQEAVVAAVDTRGGAPGTRETDLLNGSTLVDRIDGLVLSGGSAFGLAAADGLMAWLAGQGRGFPVAKTRIPIVPAAILFDRYEGGPLPDYRALARQAAELAGVDFALGNAGAGLGATAGPLKGGLGSASVVEKEGFTVGALAAANPVGSVLMPGGGVFWAWPFERDKEFGGHPPPSGALVPEEDFALPGAAQTNTTLVAVATDAELTTGQAQRIAIMAHDGIARAIRPVHTPFDGDTVFVLATGERPLQNPAGDVARLGMWAADCVARAIARGVYAAASRGDHKAYRDFIEAQQ